MNQVVHIEQHSAAPPAVVFRLLADTAGWVAWSRMDEARRERPAPGDEPEGVGARRRFRTGRSRSYEEVVAFEPDRHFAYVLLEGLPLRDYRADVTLAPAADGGTDLTWHSTFTAKVPGTGWIYRLALGRFIADTARRLADHAAAVAEVPGAGSTAAAG